MIDNRVLRFSFWLFLLVALAGISGCKVTRNFTPEQTLLQKNSIHFISEKKIPDKQKVKEDLAHIAAQQSNKKAFGFLPLKMWLYASANQPKETKFRWWIKNKVGEAPVIFDPDLADKSDKLMTTYLQNYGHFYANVTHTITTNKKKRTHVTYTVTPGPDWRFGDIAFPNAPFLTDTIFNLKKNNCFLKKGERFDVTKMKSERDRIETDLKNNGFYFFTKDYVSFELDSNKAKEIVYVKIRINQPNDSIQHQQYKVNNIYVTTDLGIEQTEVKLKRDTLVRNENFFISNKLKYRPNILLEAIFFKKDQLYSKENYNSTLRRLSDLGAFKFITVEFLRVPDKEGNYLDCIINLTPAKRQTISVEGQANINNEGYFGVAAALSYKNRNLFKGSDLLAVDLNSGVQFQFKSKQPVKIITTDFSASISYYLNKFLFPMKNRNYFKNQTPKTKFNVKYNFEKRFDFDANSNYVFFYNLHNFSASFGYEWNQNSNIRHLLNPFSFSLFLLPKPGAAFTARLDANESLKRSFQEQFILGPNYTFIYSNQKTKTDRKFMYFRANLETAGNIIMAGFSLANINKNPERPYKIANKEFSQYFRMESDLRGYYRTDAHSSFAGRVYLGAAIPYGNSLSVPFVKQFYTGGPNSLRGFYIREVGPGSYVDPTYDISKRKNGFFNQTGDMKIELNGEFRFDIYKWFKAAFFVDAGNVWLINKDKDRPNGEFNITRFWKEFAIDAGAGIRLDFNFFVVRLDYGFPIRDPRIQSSNRWKFQVPGQFQLAIGYPF